MFRHVTQLAALSLWHRASVDWPAVVVNCTHSCKLLDLRDDDEKLTRLAYGILYMHISTEKMPFKLVIHTYSISGPMSFK